MHETAQNPSERRRRHSLSADNPRLFALALLCLVAPLWVGRDLPFIDMPQHAGQVAALREMLAGNPTFTSVFDIEWFTPYLLGYLLVWVVSLVLPIDVSIQVIVSLSVVAIPILSGRLIREAGGDERWKWLTIPCSFSYALYWGFLSFIVAVPLALSFLLLTMRFNREPGWKNALLLVVSSIGLFFCHIIALGFISLVTLAYIAGANYRNWRVMVSKMLPYTAPLPLIAVWFVSTYQSEAGTHSAPIKFGLLERRLSMLLSQPAGLDTILVQELDGSFDLVRPVLALSVTGALLLFPFFAKVKFSRRPERFLPFAIAVVTFLTAPSFIFNAGFFYDRLGVFLVPLWLFCWDRAPARRLWVEHATMLIVVLWICATMARFTAFSRETLAFEGMLYTMEPGKIVGSLIANPMSKHFALPVYGHFPAWYQAKMAGIVDFNFADFYSQPVRYKRSMGPRIRDYVSVDPSKFHWDGHGGDRYDYFIVRADVDVSRILFQHKREALELVFKKDGWWLYRNTAHLPKADGVAGEESADRAAH